MSANEFGQHFAFHFHVISAGMHPSATHSLLLIQLRQCDIINNRNLFLFAYGRCLCCSEYLLK